MNSPDPVILTVEQVRQLGEELDALRARVMASLGRQDRDYLYRVIKVQRGFEVAGRALMYLGFLPPCWLAAVAALSVSKILDNMEIGHNVMHGQYDWMREPGLNSAVFEWDTVCPADQWKHSHNYRHHTFTNILDEDRDIGYGVLRMDRAQQWQPRHLANPVIALGLMVGFEWGVMMHDLETEYVWAGRRSWAELKPRAKGLWRKASRQVLKDYLVFPALTGPLFGRTLLGNAAANLVRNLWAFSIIFCGHFPDGVQTFTREQTADETRGEWYVRQLLGSANIRGGRLFHLMSGNLSHQIEHHLFPDLPACRYPQIAPEVEALCREYGLPYHTGGFFHQIGTVWAKICTLALPPSWRGPGTGPAVIVARRAGESARPQPAGV
jgi:linoleoyl-CoA desaturase